MCLGLSSAVFGLSSGSLMPWSFYDDLSVVFPDVLSCFLFDGLAYFCVLYSLYIATLLSPFPAISRRFDIRARIGDDILDLI